MSLTSQLRNPHSPMGGLMIKHFGRGTAWADRYYSVIQSAKTTKPPVPEGVPYDHVLIGTSLTYLLAWESDPTHEWTWNTLWLPQGGFFAWRLSAFEEDLWSYGPPRHDGDGKLEVAGVGWEIFLEIEAAVARLRSMSPEQRGQLAMFMGMMDHWCRSGHDWGGHLQAVGKTNTLVSILGQQRPEWVQDLMILRTRFIESLTNGPAGKWGYFPTFVGGTLVGGADADWIVGGTLIDCKATIKPLVAASVIRQYIWQLLGYAALDWNNHLGIEELGLYMARQGAWVIWNGDELCRLASDGQIGSLTELRTLVKNTLEREADSKEKQPKTVGVK